MTIATFDIFDPIYLEIQSRRIKRVTKVAMVMTWGRKAFWRATTKYWASEQKGYKMKFYFWIRWWILLHRFSKTRRNTSAFIAGIVMDGINRERVKLSPLKQMADKIIDNDFPECSSVERLKCKGYFLILLAKMIIHVLLLDTCSDCQRCYMTLDVRFLPNPYFVEDLKIYDGHNIKVVATCLNLRKAGCLYKNLFELMEFLIPLYEKRGKPGSHTLDAQAGDTGSVVMAMSWCVF